jgi:hypothetical protein
MTNQFLTVFVAVVVLTVVCGGAAGSIALAYGAKRSPSLAQYQKVLLRVFAAGAVAIFALLR